MAELSPEQQEALAEAIRTARWSVLFLGGRPTVADILAADLAPLIAGWLAEAQEKAWDECFDDCYEQIEQGINPGNRNPYRADRIARRKDEEENVVGPLDGYRPKKPLPEEPLEDYAERYDPR